MQDALGLLLTPFDTEILVRKPHQLANQRIVSRGDPPPPLLEVRALYDGTIDVIDTVLPSKQLRLGGSIEENLGNVNGDHQAEELPEIEDQLGRLRQPPPWTDVNTQRSAG